MKLRLYLDNRTDMHGRHPVRLSVAFMGKRFVTSLGETFNEEEFENFKADFFGTTPVSKTKHKNHRELLHRLQAISDAIEWEQKKVERGECTIDEVDLSAVVNKVKGRKAKKKLSDRTPASVWVEFLSEESKKKNLRQNTLNAMTSFFNKFCIFAKDKSLNELSTMESVERWVQWNAERGVNNTTVRDKYNQLLWFLSWCFRKGYCSDDFRRFRFELKTANQKENAVVFLTLDEIERFASVPVDGKMALSRDIFLFQCFTGLRISDVRKLKPTDIRNGIMSLTIQKTGTHIENRLNNRALDILNKYLPTAKETVFPFINFESLLINLRKIGEMAGIDEPIRRIEYRNNTRTEMVVPKWQLLTTHVGRKSFVVNSLDMGLTATQVIGYTGHSSITAMQPYISISRKKKDAAMDVWNNATVDNDNEVSKLEDEIKRLKARLEALKKHDQ